MNYKVLNDLADGRHLVIALIDHCIGDGIALCNILLNLADGGVDIPLLDRSLPPSLPWYRTIPIFIQGVLLGLSAAIAPKDKASRLKLPLAVASKEKRCAKGCNISLQQVKMIQSVVSDCTVNDVLVAIATIALKLYLADEHASIGACFPIDMRPHIGRVDHGGNHFVLGRYHFDFSYDDPMHCLAKVVGRTIVMKHSPAPLIE